MKEVIAKGAYIYLIDKEELFSLYFVSHNGHSEIVKEPLAKGAKIDVQSNTGDSALMLASSNERENFVDMLIMKGSDVL